jgi:sulfide:quinone oxidoreductase
MGDCLDLTLIDKNDSFFFGYSKLDVMFGRRSPASVRYPYGWIEKQGVRFRQERITGIDPVTRRVTTDRNSYEADVLVIALGADYDIPATPGLAEAGFEFYSFEGAERIRTILPGIVKGHVLIGVTGFPFKCPQAPSEVALLLHAYLDRQGVRANCEISLVLPFELPIPPSYRASMALLDEFQTAGINFIPDIMVGAIEPGRKVAELDDGREVPFDWFLGIPEHRVPEVVAQSGLVFDEWVPVEKKNLKTRYPHVYAIGDITSVGTPKAGIFAREAARIAADSIASEYFEKKHTGEYSGKGSCYIEHGNDRVSRVDVDFFSAPAPTGKYLKASAALAQEKQSLELSSGIRWFGPEFKRSANQPPDVG